QPNAMSYEFTKFEYANGYDVSCHYCADGNMKIAAVGGIEPYSYRWYDSDDTLISTADSISSLGAGEYFVIITDANGCSITDNNSLTVSQSPYVGLQIT